MQLFIGQSIARCIVLEHGEEHVRRIILPVLRQLGNFAHDLCQELCHAVSISNARDYCMLCLLCDAGLTHFVRRLA
jgi:hypothetical protein